jgi:CubicO group peptidase (beta-lactamase class C family)
MWTASPVSLDEELQLLRDEYAATPPGTAFAYSAVGMTLLGHALEKIVDRDFAAHMGIALFLPLRMESSAFSPKIDHSPLASRAYRNNEEAVEPPLRDIPALGLNTSVLDLSRFMAMVFGDGWYSGRQVLKGETLAAMLRPRDSRPPLDLDFASGLGWMLGPMDGMEIRNAGPVAHQGGATLQHRGHLVVLPEQKLGVVVLANSASAGRLVNQVAVETLKLALEAKAGITQAPLPRKSSSAEEKERRQQLRRALEAQYGAQQPRAGSEGLTAEEVKAGEREERKPLTPAELQAYEGVYDTAAGVAKLTKKGDYLEVELRGRSVRLIPSPDGLLEMEDRTAGLFPISPDTRGRVCLDKETIGGHDILKGILDGREYRVAERLKPAAIPPAWQQRAGAYEIVNSGDDTLPIAAVRLNAGDDLLTLEYTTLLSSDQPLNLVLTPLSETEAVIAGLGRGKGETIRVITRGDGELLAYSGYLLRKRAE